MVKERRSRAVISARFETRAMVDSQSRKKGERRSRTVVRAGGATKAMSFRVAPPVQFGLNIRSTSVIDISYFYFWLVLGCIDADLCKYILVFIFSIFPDLQDVHSFAPLQS